MNGPSENKFWAAVTFAIGHFFAFGAGIFITYMMMISPGPRNFLWMAISAILILGIFAISLLVSYLIMKLVWKYR